MTTSLAKSDEMDVVRRYMNNVPVDVRAIIEELGVDYIEEPMQDNQSGRIDYNDPFCIITINSNESAQRQRFTAAHELGHFLLHRDLLRHEGHLDRLFGIEQSENPVSPLKMKHEVQANRFAAELLMPSRLVKRYFAEYSGDANRIAKQFEVSIAATNVRLKSLGLI